MKEKTKNKGIALIFSILGGMFMLGLIEIATPIPGWFRTIFFFIFSMMLYNKFEKEKVFNESKGIEGGLNEVLQAY